MTLADDITGKCWKTGHQRRSVLALRDDSPIGKQ